jgi:hypothetical protein
MQSIARTGVRVDASDHSCAAGQWSQVGSADAVFSEEQECEQITGGGVVADQLWGYALGVLEHVDGDGVGEHRPGLGPG